MRRIVDIVAVTAIFTGGANAGVLDLLPPDVYQQADRCIGSIYAGDFKTAEREARRILKDFPDHPAGYFFYAVALDVWMEYYQSTDKEEEFYRYCDLAIEKSERLIDKEPANPWVGFFMGGAEGYKGTYESRLGRWITAFRFGWKGVSQLMEVNKKSPEMHDANYGIGSYEYWRSAMTRKLTWLPGVTDKREEGIEKLRDAAANGIFTRIPASVGLIKIMCNENRYEEALKLSQEMMAKFPGSLVFLWGEAEAFFGLRRFADAEKAFRTILSRVEAESYDNHYNAVVCHFWLARIHLETRSYTQCIAECNRMGYYKFDDDIAERLKKFFEDSELIRKQATAARARSLQSQLVP